ncbi:hypothetical protein N8J89_09640 [Crossiella sp. CA-258035]|uniref:hypothetical protein n=1 Tax=Crossiella sp. CA-258035 TaxID=2981138 RepID=UPI0024BCE86F|nr:hypothetical protein [Crossiella sp. CA-258035]WHT21296.1 hypothetical protein N8J89_09640 [Crossiella sp. CA-258035]
MGIRRTSSVAGGLAIFGVAAALLAVPVWLFTGLFDGTGAQENAETDATRRANALGDHLARLRLSGVTDHARLATEQAGVQVLRTEGVERALGGVSLLVRITGEGWRSNWMTGDRRSGPPEATATRCFTLEFGKPGRPDGAANPTACVEASPLTFPAPTTAPDLRQNVQPTG